MLRAVCALVLLLVFGTNASAAPRVMASIKPLHSLVAAVMAGVSEPSLLVKGTASPHTYSLKPSDARELQEAGIVFWIGPGLETFLQEPLKKLAPDATVVALAETPGLTLLPVREGGAFEVHEEHEEHADEAHEEAAHGHAHEGTADMHFWLDPANAALVSARIAEALAKADPENAARYTANAAALEQQLMELAGELRATLASVAGRPFMLFHDSLQYFETRFGLTVVGTVAVSPEASPSAQRVRELHEKLTGLGPACIFAEPQFAPAVIDTIAEGTGARIGTIDPEGAALSPGPALYPELLRSLAKAISGCLAGTA